MSRFRYIPKLQYICNVYMGSRRAIYNNIAPKPRVFFRPRLENSRGHGVLPEGIFLPRTKKPEVEAAILLYIARRDPIYIIYTPHYLQSLSKNTNSSKMQHSTNTKINDAVTKRQFERFLPKAKLPPRWMGKVWFCFSGTIWHNMIIVLKLRLEYFDTVPSLGAIYYI